MKSAKLKLWILGSKSQVYRGIESVFLVQQYPFHLNPPEFGSTNQKLSIVKILKDNICVKMLDLGWDLISFSRKK